MLLDTLTKNAITHTLHCLAGCSIGEVLGMVLGNIFNWGNLLSIIISIALAFFFGYLLTIISIKKRSQIKTSKAIKAAVATDTVSIISMEAIDNAFIWLVPGALNAHLSSWLFWLSLAAALIIAFILTVPVNRWFLSQSHSDHIGHMHH